MLDNEKKNGEDVKTNNTITDGGVALHNVLFVQYLLLATEQVGTYFKSCILLYHLTYIYPNSFGCEQNIL